MIISLGRRILIGASTALWLLQGGVSSFAQAPDGSLRAQVEALANAEGFAVSGLDQIVGPVPEILPKGSIADRRLSKTVRRLQMLLQSYDYILLRDVQGRIAELRIFDPQVSLNTKAEHYAVPSTSAGGAQVMTVEISGPNNRPMKLPFVADAEATTVMLPTSHIKWLGFIAQELKDDWIETSDGRIPVKLGRLDFLEVGPASAWGVAVAFVDHDRIGGEYFLGTRFLSRFGVSLESGDNGLVFIAR